MRQRVSAFAYVSVRHERQWLQERAPAQCVIVRRFRGREGVTVRVGGGDAVAVRQTEKLVRIQE